MGQADPSALTGADILVVDADQSTLRQLAAILGAHGCAVRLAVSGQAALEAVAHATPDLALVALELPDIGGNAVCAQLKRDPHTCDVPVIALGSRHATADAVRAFAAGAVDVIARPCAAEEVLARVRVHLSVQALQRQLRGHVEQLEREVVERRQVEEALRHREELLRSVSDSLPRGYIYQIEVSPEGGQRYLYASGGIRETTEVAPEDAYRDASLVLGQLLPEDRARLAAMTAAVTRDRPYFEFEGRARGPSGRIRWMYVRSTPRFLDDGRTVFSGIALDVTARKQVEEILRQRVDELEALNLIAQGLTRWTDVAEGITAAGPAIRALFDAAIVSVWACEPAAHVLRRLVTVCDEGAARPADLLHAGVVAGAPVKVAALAPDDPLVGAVDAFAGTARSVMLVTLFARAEPVGLLSIVGARPEQIYLPSDVVIAQTLGGLLASAVENARLFAQAQLVAAEQERRRLARELHDSVSQALYAANRAAEAIPVIWELDPDEGRERLAELRRFTHSALAEMQALLVELHPRALAERPLHKSLGLLADALEAKGGLAVMADLQPVPLLAPDVQVMLYRIAQEALTNVGKHARASAAGLRIAALPPPCDGQPWQGRITLVVEDDGRGFPAEAAAAGRMGLVSMRERAADIGAELTLSSRPGAGTRVTVCWNGASTEK
jgi:signal transduction histidine kinase/CheY-like chemotaxis protein